MSCFRILSEENILQPAMTQDFFKSEIEIFFVFDTRYQKQYFPKLKKSKFHFRLQSLPAVRLIS